MLIAHDSNEAPAKPGARAAALAPAPRPASAPTVCIQTIEAGGAVAAHVHREADELVYVLEGRLDVRLGERKASLKAGMSVALPRGLTHGFDNVGERAARILVVLASGQGARFLDALAQARSGLPDEAAKLAALLVQREMYVVT